MPGLPTALKLVQLGQESTWGTAVAATVKLMGVEDASITIADVQAQAKELGRLNPSPIVAQVAQSAAFAISGIATYEDDIYLNNGLLTSVAPTGAGPYVWANASPSTAATTPKKWTLEYGVTGAAYKVAGALFSKISWKMEAGGWWMYSIDGIGKVVSTVTLASLSDRSVEAIRAADTALYIDAVGGTMGATAVPAVLRSCELTHDAKRHLKIFAGALTPGDYGEDMHEGELKVTFEYTSAVKAYVDAILSGLVQKQIRLKATSGTKIWQHDFAGYIADAPKLFEDAEGNITCSLSFKAHYNSTLGDWHKTSVTNSVASLV